MKFINAKQLKAFFEKVKEKSNIGDLDVFLNNINYVNNNINSASNKLTSNLTELDSDPDSLFYKYRLLDKSNSHTNIDTFNTYKNNINNATSDDIPTVKRYVVAILTKSHAVLVANFINKRGFGWVKAYENSNITLLNFATSDANIVTKLNSYFPELKCTTNTSAEAPNTIVNSSYYYQAYI